MLQCLQVQGYQSFPVSWYGRNYYDTLAEDIGLKTGDEPDLSAAAQFIRNESEPSARWLGP